MVKLYAFLWHVSVEEIVASEGASGYHCDSAETEKLTREKAEKILENWLQERQRTCKVKNCEHTPIITSDIRPKMIMAGMTVNMVKL